MSNRNTRMGQLTGVSKDKGPYKLVEVEHDGKKDFMQVIEPYGMQSSPHQDGQCLVMVPDGDEGKAVCIVMPRPKDRQDKLKEGESKHMNHDTGNGIHHTVVDPKAKKKVGDTNHDSSRHIRFTTKGIMFVNSNDGNQTS